MDPLQLRPKRPRSNYGNFAERGGLKRKPTSYLSYEPTGWLIAKMRCEILVNDRGVVGPAPISPILASVSNRSPGETIPAPSTKDTTSATHCPCTHLQKPGRDHGDQTDVFSIPTIEEGSRASAFQGYSRNLSCPASHSVWSLPSTDLRPQIRTLQFGHGSYSSSTTDFSSTSTTPSHVSRTPGSYTIPGTPSLIDDVDIPSSRSPKISDGPTDSESLRSPVDLPTPHEAGATRPSRPPISENVLIIGFHGFYPKRMTRR